MSEPVRRALPPSVFARLADATRYVITGVSPDTWFGPLQPLAPMAPPEVKGRQWDYPFGANAAQARDHGFKRAFQLLAIALGGENLGDPDVGAAF